MHPIVEGFFLSIHPLNIVGILFGYSLGVVVGSLPGLTGVMAIALILPLTYKLQPLFAIASLMGCYKGATYGGSVSAILLNTPGTPEAAATAMDGYPLMQKGQGRRALEMALIASVVGGTISDLILMGVADPLATIALKFGPAEITGLIFFSLTVIAATIGTTPIEITRGLVAAGAGLFFAMIGLDIMTTTRRYTFGLPELDRGLNFVVVLIGLLAFSEVLFQVERIREANKTNVGAVKTPSHQLKLTWADRINDLKICWKDIVKSSFIGTFIGALPGIGATTAAFLSYGEARRSSKDPQSFGKGNIRGIAAAEAGNNGVCGASLIPLVTLGIPGSVTAAVLLGAFMIHGMMPGPMLMRTHPSTLYGLFFLMIWTDPIGGLCCAIPYMRLAERVIKRIRPSLLFSIVTVLCVIGAYGMQFSIFDIKIMIFFGVLGYFMKKYKFPIPSFLIAFILGPILENNARIALAINRGNPSIFLKSPVALVLFSLGVISLIWSFMRGRRKKMEK